MTVPNDSRLIVHIITGTSIGGAEMMLYKLLSRMSPRFRSYVICLGEEGTIGERIRQLGIPVECLGINPSSPNPVIFKRLVASLRELKPDMIQTWLYHADLLGTLAGRLAGIRKVAWNLRCSSLDARETPFSTRLILRLLARMSGIPEVVVVNSLNGRKVHEAIGYRPRRWEFIPNGFDIDLFRPDPRQRSEIRRSLGLNETQPVFGMFARYHPMKDHSTFLRAAAIVSSDEPSARFVLAGTQITEENSGLYQQVKESGLTGKVFLMGARNDVHAIMAGIDCLVSSSAWGEGFPNVMGEAMACGVPCIATDVGDSAFVAGDTGFIVPPSDVQALAAAMKKLLSLGEEQRRQMGIAARQRIIEKFSLETVTAQYERLYEDICSGSQ